MGTRVRMTTDVPRTSRELPALPPEPTARYDRQSVDGERTVVDPSLPAFLRDEEGAAPPEIDPDRTVPRSRLPLPPPTRRSSEELGRPTLPGTRAARMSPPRPVPRRRSAGKQHTRYQVDDTTAVAADPLAPLPGPLVGGRYRIVSRVGAGGMGKVFKVTHAQLGKTFALKIIRKTFAERPTSGAPARELGDESKARDLFYREARLASSLSHPNIASVVDFGEDEERGAFMVMEFLDGEPLSKILHRDGPMPLRQALDVMMQAAEALHYIHSNKIVHCDIKTENMLLCEVPGTNRRGKQLKLLDFGLARSTAAARNTGSLSGTPHYVAPECIRGKLPSPASDIYGLGILFYELLTGKVPWDGNVSQILAGHLDLAPTPPSQLIEGGLDPAVEKLILRALEKEPEDRHKDVAAFIYELRTVLDMLGFGRQRRGSMRKVVIERPTSQRDELARTVFDITRVPLALINKDGTIAVANMAFAKFVMGVAVDVHGKPVAETPLAAAWASFDVDLARACGGEPVRRVIEVDIGEAGEVRRLMMWLDPGSSDDNAVFGVHPLDG